MKNNPRDNSASAKKGNQKVDDIIILLAFLLGIPIGDYLGFNWMGIMLVVAVVFLFSALLLELIRLIKRYIAWLSG